MSPTMGTFFIVINVIITLLIKFSTQLIYNQSDTYQFNSQYAIDTNELSDEENEQLMAFNPCLVHYCPKGMECIITTSNFQPSCICQRQCIVYNKRKKRHVCGTNGKVYNNYCELYRDACQLGQKIGIQQMSICLKQTQLVSADDAEMKNNHERKNLKGCTIQQYDLMKDNLLLYNHENLIYLKNEPGIKLHKQHHSMEYLVSIIFSHYDQNNDGLVENHELMMIWNDEDIHKVSNDSNCSLIDMLHYDDINDDNVLTINEFNQAFSRMFKNDANQITLEKSLEINHLSVHVGDNVEIKCDITAKSSQPEIVWQRYNFDLTLMNDTSNEDYGEGYDEIRTLNDGGLYIQNVQMKHAGNFSCQAVNDRSVVQMHMVTVHATPYVLVLPLMQSKRPSEFAEIICHAIGERVMSLNWSKNDIPLTINEAKYEFVGNGTLLMIKNLTFSDTGAYTCSASNAGGTTSQVSTLVVQSEPTPIASNHEQKLFVFHDYGISIYKTTLCQLEHAIRANDLIPGTTDSVCSSIAKRCDWGKAIYVGSDHANDDSNDGLIYVTQPYMNRILVISIFQMIILETIETDRYPLELMYVPNYDQIWVVSWKIHTDETIKHDPEKGIEMIPDARMIHVRHHAIHPETVNSKFDGAKDFYVPPAIFSQNFLIKYYDFMYGFVTHHNQRGFYKLDLQKLRYSKYVDLSIYDCVPEHIKFSGLYGFIIISCSEPVTHRETGQLVLDYITNSIISIKADLVGVPYISPDSRYVITVNRRHDSVLLSVQQITSNGLVFTFDVETTLNINDVTFAKSATSLDYDVFATTDKEEILYLNLETGKVETVGGVGQPGMVTWFTSGRPIKESDLYNNLIASPSKNAVYMINTRTRNVLCEIDELENPTVVVWG